MPLTPQNTDPNVGVLVPVITKPGKPSHQADAVWGGVVGTLSNQTDLQNALDAKADASALGSAATADTGDFAAASHSHASTDLSDASATGRALLTAADATAARATLGVSAPAWGSITGTLSSQTDLQSALDAKAAASHNHDGVYVKPASLAAVATSGRYADLSGKPSIPAAQVNADWSAASGVAQILNKPALGSAASASTGDFATAAQGAKADTALQAADITGKLDKTGGTMTGAISFAGAQTWPTFNQNTTGSAAKLTTSRTINGTGFDGAGNITTANWGTSRTLTIGSKGYSVNGSGNVTWTLADIGAAAAAHSHSNATTSAAGFMSAADKTKLDGIASGAQANAVTSVAGRTGAVVIASSDVSGLGSMATKSAVAVADISATGTPGSATYLRGDGKWETPAGGGASLPSQTGQAGKYLKTDGTDASWATVAGGAIAPGTIQYFASDPGAGWLKCDGSTYLRSSYADLSAALPINLLNCPPSFGGAEYTGLGGTIKDIANIPGTNYLLLHCSGWSGKQLELLEFDPSTQSVSRVGNAASYAGASTGGMSVAQDGGTTYVACLTPTSASRLDLFKIVGTTITKLSSPATLPASAKIEACAFYNGGANLAIGLSAGEPTSDVRIWTYSRSGDTFTKDAEIGSLPASPVSFRSMSVSPSGKTLWATLDRESSKKGHLFDVSGSTLTNLTEDAPDPLNEEFNVAFAPRSDIDLWFSGSRTLVGKYRLGSTNSVIGVGRVSNSSGEPAHVGANQSIAFSSGGDLLVTSSSIAPWRSVFRVSPDFVLTPMFSSPDASMDSYGSRLAVFTPDTRCIVTKSATDTTLQLIRSDTTKLIVPRLSNGWIKT